MPPSRAKSPWTQQLLFGARSSTTRLALSITSVRSRLLICTGAHARIPWQSHSRPRDLKAASRCGRSTACRHETYSLKLVVRHLCSSFRRQSVAYVSTSVVLCRPAPAPWRDLFRQPRSMPRPSGPHAEAPRAFLPPRTRSPPCSKPSGAHQTRAFRLHMSLDPSAAGCQEGQLPC